MIRKPQKICPPEPECRPFGWNHRWTVPGICLFLGIITFAVFGQTLGHDFINYDDQDYVYENPQVLGGLTFKGIIWAFTHAFAGNWHPLTGIPEAVETAQHALQRAEALSNTAQADVIRAQMKLYQTGLPFHTAEQPP